MSVHEPASVVAARQLAAEAREGWSPIDLAERVARRRARRLLLEGAGLAAQP